NCTCCTSAGQRDVDLHQNYIAAGQRDIDLWARPPPHLSEQRHGSPPTRTGHGWESITFPLYKWRPLLHLSEQLPAPWHMHKATHHRLPARGTPCATHYAPWLTAAPPVPTSEPPPVPTREPPSRHASSACWKKRWRSSPSTSRAHFVQPVSTSAASRTTPSSCFPSTKRSPSASAATAPAASRAGGLVAPRGAWMSARTASARGSR